MKKIYISGQISGCPIDKAREKLERAEELIRQMGAEPVNPMKNGLPENAPWELHMALDIVLLMGCESIYLLPDWEHSRGATLEKTIAELTGKQIIYEKTTRNEDIKQAITEVTGLLFHEIAGDSRKTIAVHARMIYSNLCYSIARIKETAADLNRSTSSVHYYLEQHRNEYKFNPAFRELADKVNNRLIQIQQRENNKQRMLSAGICDTCSIPKMMNTGDGINEPLDPILYCHKMKREICPEPPEDRMVECRFYTCR